MEEYINELVKYQKKYPNFLKLQEKITFCLTVLNGLARKAIPDKIVNLEFSEDEIIAALSFCPDILEIQDKLLDLRQVVIETYGLWHIFSQEFVFELEKFLDKKKTLQLMAGNGALAKFIPEIKATDNFEWQGQDIQSPTPWVEVEQIDALEAVKEYGGSVENIILEWAPDTEETDYQILKYLRQNQWQGRLIVIGEKNGATNSKPFWQKAQVKEVHQLNVVHPAIDFIKDKVFLIK